MSERDLDHDSLHFVLHTPTRPPFPRGMQRIDLALGCYWGAERLFWQLPGVYTTAVGFEGGHLESPDYARVCRGDTGHAETVLVVYDPEKLTAATLLRTFFENHDPTQGDRQGADIGSQYRSVIFATTDEQYRQALAVRDAYARSLDEGGHHAPITTQVLAPDPARRFHYAHAEHQQYLAKNPSGYCGLGGTGIKCAGV